jgi:hypothetical protein
MKHIKKYNEDIMDKYSVSHNHVTGHSSFPYSKKDILNTDDFKKIHRSGRKVYLVNRKYEIVEVPTISHLKLITREEGVDMKPAVEFQYLLFIPEEKVNKFQDLVTSIGKMKNLYEEKIKLLFDMIRAKSEEVDI